jgi:hypothetical protein
MGTYDTPDAPHPGIGLQVSCFPGGDTKSANRWRAQTAA